LLTLDTPRKPATNACTFTQLEVNRTGVARSLDVVIVVGLAMRMKMELRIFLHWGGF
jgi:hypothetical protein